MLYNLTISRPTATPVGSLLTSTLSSFLPSLRSPPRAKTEFFLRIEYLWDLFDKESIPLEDFVRSHDADLEHNPLSDFYINRTSLSQAANPDHM